jgi:redox-sensitive bicupin YhaK (pirin superfamily)
MIESNIEQDWRIGMSKTGFVGKECGHFEEEHLEITAYPNRKTNLGQLEISRALPIREHRLVGPWCFLDRFGPMTFSAGKPMNVLPHPHIGLQTVTWLLEGEVLHTDSIDSEAVVRPGGVNIMTAGNGIAHAEMTPTDNSGNLNGVQLWVALPEKFRKITPFFNAIKEVPTFKLQGGSIRLFAGAYQKSISPGSFYSDLLGMELEVQPHHQIELELNPQFEHAALVLSGDCSFGDQNLEHQTLYYLGPNRTSLCIQSNNGGKILLIGGLPFPEKILMWWNFVARTPEEIAKARSDWEKTDWFGTVRGKHNQRLSAPDLARFAQPNPAS